MISVRWRQITEYRQVVAKQRNVIHIAPLGLFPRSFLSAEHICRSSIAAAFRCRMARRALNLSDRFPALHPTSD